MTNYVFVLDAAGKQLAPTKETKAWFFIRKEHATLVSKYPMVIQLNKEVSDDEICKDEIRCGIDDGGLHVGIALVQKCQTKNKVVFKGTIEQRNDVKHLMDVRRGCRHYHRCTMEKVSKLVRKLNNHKGMNASQKALTWIPTYARQAKSIGEEGFFKNSMTYSDTDRKNGNYIQLVCNSVMALFHIDEFKKDSKSANAMLEEKSNHQEFETVRNILQRMEKCCGSSCTDVFVKKDISTWVKQK